MAQPYLSLIRILKTLCGAAALLAITDGSGAHGQPSSSPECPKLSPSPGPTIKSCTNTSAVPCAKFDTSLPLTLRSNRCLAERQNAGVRDGSGKAVDYTWFGATDCRAGHVRSLDSISLAVIHNGGTTAAQNVINLQCGENATAAHYSIQRDP